MSVWRGRRRYRTSCRKLELALADPYHRRRQQMRDKVIVAVLLVCAVIAVAGCAAGPNVLKGEAD